jgi:hypothetical protein
MSYEPKPLLLAQVSDDDRMAHGLEVTGDFSWGLFSLRIDDDEQVPREIISDHPDLIDWVKANPNRTAMLVVEAGDGTQVVCCLDIKQLLEAALWVHKGERLEDSTAKFLDADAVTGKLGDLIGWIMAG